MFSIYIKDITENTVQKIIDDAKYVIRACGFITVENLFDIIEHSYKNYKLNFSNCQNINFCKDGWDDENLNYSIEQCKDGLNLSLDDPKILNAENNEDGILSEVLALHEKLSKSKKDFDPIRRPAYYAKGRKYEPRKVIFDWGLNFNLGNAVKYISRAGRKEDKIKDLEKAIQYIKFEIEELLEKENENE